MNSDAARGEGVIRKVFGCLYVIVAVVGPVQVYFLAVVRDGVAFAFRVTAFGDEVALPVLAAESSFHDVAVEIKKCFSSLIFNMERCRVVFI
jgi:hypothetical protein